MLNPRERIQSGQPSYRYSYWHTTCSSPSRISNTQSKLDSAVDESLRLTHFPQSSPIFHQVAYAIIQLTTTFRTTQLLFTKLKSSDKERNLVKKVKTLEQRGSIIFVSCLVDQFEIPRPCLQMWCFLLQLLGFLVWNIENQTSVS